MKTPNLKLRILVLRALRSGCTTSTEVSSFIREQNVYVTRQTVHRILQEFCTQGYCHISIEILEKKVFRYQIPQCMENSLKKGILTGNLKEARK